MAKAPYDMGDSTIRNRVVEDAKMEALMHVSEGHPNVARSDEEIQELHEHVLSYRLEHIDPSDEWLFRDIFRRNFLGKYNEVLARMDKHKQIHDENERRSLMTINERWAESPLLNLPSYSKKKKRG